MSVLVVTVVVPPGVAIFSSLDADAFSVLEHPINPIETNPEIRTAAMTRFIFVSFLRT